MSEAPILETPRLILRPHRASDFEAVHAMWCEPEVFRHITGRPSRREESWARLLRYAGHWQLMGFGFWAIEEKASGQFLGEAGFADFRRDMEPNFGGTPEMGWILAPAFHGKGYGSEATARLVDWARNHIGHPVLACMISPGNAASVALARKLGFIKTGSGTYSGDPVLLMRLPLGDQA